MQIKDKESNDDKAKGRTNFVHVEQEEFLLINTTT